MQPDRFVTIEGSMQSRMPDACLGNPIMNGLIRFAHQKSPWLKNHGVIFPATKLSELPQHT